MDSELVSVLKEKTPRLVNDGAVSHKPKIELSLHTEYNLLQRPDVQIERSVWIQRGRYGKV